MVPTSYPSCQGHPNFLPLPCWMRKKAPLCWKPSRKFSVCLLKHSKVHALEGWQKPCQSRVKKEAWWSRILENERTFHGTHQRNETSQPARILPNIKKSLLRMRWVRIPLIQYFQWKTVSPIACLESILLARRTPVSAVFPQGRRIERMDVAKFTLLHDEHTGARTASISPIRPWSTNQIQSLRWQD